MEDSRGVTSAADKSGAEHAQLQYVYRGQTLTSAGPARVQRRSSMEQRMPVAVDNQAPHSECE